MYSARSIPTPAASPENIVVAMKPQRSARLVIEAECTTCGRIGDAADGLSTVQLAMEHTVATGHIVILNGTTDLPDADDLATTPFGDADLTPSSF